jgi:hypothetical protein
MHKFMSLLAIGVLPLIAACVAEPLTPLPVANTYNPQPTNVPYTQPRALAETALDPQTVAPARDPRVIYYVPQRPYVCPYPYNCAYAYPTNPVDMAPPQTAVPSAQATPPAAPQPQAVVSPTPDPIASQKQAAQDPVVPQKQDTPPAEDAAADTSADTSSAPNPALMRIQIELENRGLYHGPVDGVLNDEMVAAMQSSLKHKQEQIPTADRRAGVLPPLRSPQPTTLPVPKAQTDSKIPERAIPKLPEHMIGQLQGT